jgi:ubiquinol-cytochrome c reductase cytochrome b subunit
MLFVEKGCLGCHQIGSQGGQRGPNLTAVGRRLSREQLTWRILYGGNNMPAYGTALSPIETDSLLDFLETTGDTR